MVTTDDAREGSGPVPEHPRVPDALARAVLQAFLDQDTLGIALLRSTDWAHVMTSPRYERLVGQSSTLGRPAFDVLPEKVAPRALLEQVVASGRSSQGLSLLTRTGYAQGVPAMEYVSLTFLRVRRVSEDCDGVLVLAEDVSPQIHDRRLGELFVALATDMSGEPDEAASIRSSVARTSETLRADAASLFLLSPDGKRLHGALVGWDWTRTSFIADLEDWPNVGRLVAANQAGHLTIASALRAESAWFEKRGITATICAPMTANGRVLGVLFFDYFGEHTARVDLDLAKDVADQCARLVVRAAERQGQAGAMLPGVPTSP